MLKYFYSFHFLVKYCSDDSLILCHIGLKFTAEWCKLQKEFCAYFDKQLTIMFTPFCPPFITLGSFIFGLYRFFLGNDQELYAIPDEKGTKTIRHSWLERKWVLEKFEEYSRPSTFISLHTSNRAPKISHYIPDYVLYYDDMKTIKEIGLFQGNTVNRINVHFKKLYKLHQGAFFMGTLALTVI